MSDIGCLKDFYSSVEKPKLSDREEHVAKTRERLRRERKEKLYSYTPKNRKALP